MPPRRPPPVQTRDLPASLPPTFNAPPPPPQTQAPPPPPPVAAPVSLPQALPALPGASRREAVNGLLHAIAVREVAAAGLLNAEAEKVAQLARTMVRPETFDEVLMFQRTVADLLQAMVRKEEVLLRKLNAVLALCSDEEKNGGLCDDISDPDRSGSDSTETSGSDETDGSGDEECAPQM